MELGTIVEWLNKETECYAQDMYGDGILLDGVLALSEILELTTKILKQMNKK